MRTIPPLNTRRAARLSALLALSTLACASPLHAQRVVPVHEEPRHKLMFEGGGLRVLDLQIAPGDTSLYHLHATPILYTSVSVSCTIEQLVGGDWPPPGTPRPFTTPIGNELLGTPELSNSWFRQTRVTLSLGDTTPFKQATRTVVAILPMSGSATIERNGGAATVLSTPGAFTVIVAGTRYRLRHASGPTAEVVLVQPH